METGDIEEQFSRTEEELRHAADAELEPLSVARHATKALASAVNGTSIPVAPEPAPPDWYLRAAILNLCLIALRSARGCLVLIASGYEPEAQGLKRRVSEVYARMGAVVDDTSGQHARQWLEGAPPSTPRKITGKFGSLELFDLYSQSEHADARGITSWLAIPMPEIHEHHRGLIFVPHRRPEFANAMLVELAHEVRDLAQIMARSRGLSVPDLGILDAEIRAARERWYSD